MQISGVIKKSGKHGAGVLILLDKEIDGKKHAISPACIQDGGFQIGDRITGKNNGGARALMISEMTVQKNSKDMP